MDRPHVFEPETDRPGERWCVCGRIESIGGYSPIHIDIEIYRQRTDEE